MDRKGWIVVSLCAILMVLNWHYMQENQKAAQAEAARKQAEKAKTEAVWKEAGDQITLALRGGFKKLVDHAVDFVVGKLAH
jgi:predicted negative regulator of RcsB-dependent stress response